MSAAAEPISHLREIVNAFLIREATLADLHRYDEWLELWSPDAIYWVPCNEDEYDPTRHVSIVYDDYDRLQERCFRLSSEGAHAQDPPSRLCRILGNVEIVAGGSSESELLEVRANMHLVECRFREKNVYGARVEYSLRRDGDTFKLARKKVTLMDNDEPLGNLTFLL